METDSVPADDPPRRVELSLRDGYATYGWLYAPAGDGGQPRPPVVYVHGIQSHPGWFTRSCGALARAGHAVLAVARRGSGENTVARGHARSAWQLMEDLDDAVVWMCKHTGAAKAHLVGVSWGGKLAAAYCQAVSGGRATRDQFVVRVASLTLVAPGIVPRVDVGWRTKLAVASSLVGRPGRLFDIPLSDVALFTDNEAGRAFLRGDPHRLTRATARFLFASRVLDWRLSRAGAGGLTVPTTLLLASRDRIIDNDATATAIRRLTGGNARVVTLNGAHTMDFEESPDEFLTTLAAATGY